MEKRLLIKGIHRLYREDSESREYVLRDKSGNLFFPHILNGNVPLKLGYQRAKVFTQKMGCHFIHLSPNRSIDTLPKIETDLETISGSVNSEINLEEVFGRGIDPLRRILDKIQDNSPLTFRIEPYNHYNSGIYLDVIKDLRYGELLRKMKDPSQRDIEELTHNFPYTEVRFTDSKKINLGYTVKAPNLDEISRKKCKISRVGFYSVSNSVESNDGLPFNFYFETSYPEYLIGQVKIEDVSIEDQRRDSQIEGSFPFEHFMELRFPLHNRMHENHEFLVAQIRESR